MMTGSCGWMFVGSSILVTATKVPAASSWTGAEPRVSLPDWSPWLRRQVTWAACDWPHFQADAISDVFIHDCTLHRRREPREVSEQAESNATADFIVFQVWQDKRSKIRSGLTSRSPTTCRFKHSHPPDLFVRHPHSKRTAAIGALRHSPSLLFNRWKRSLTLSWCWTRA